jgi:hypothetical protein
MAKPSPFAPKPKPIVLEGTEALTVLQAKALLKAAKAILLRHSLMAEDDTITDREYQSLYQAVAKLEYAAML